MVNKTTLFIASNIRKSRKSLVTVTAFFILAAVLLNISFFLIVDYRENFFREKDRLAGEDMSMIYSAYTDQTDNLNRALADINEIKDFETDNIVFGVANTDFKQGILSGLFSFYGYSDATSKKIGKFDILESKNNGGIYLSLIFKLEGGYRAGDDIEFDFNGKKYNYKIAGFYSNVNTGTTNTMDYSVILPDDDFSALKSVCQPSNKVCISLKDPNAAQITESVIANKIAEKVEAVSLEVSATFIKNSNSRYISVSLFKAIITAAAFLLIAILLVIISITISNYINNNIRALGTLKAAGFTSNGLIFPLVIEYGTVAFVSSVIGTALSYGILPSINRLFEGQVGLPYKVRFLVVPAVISILICLLCAVVSTYFSSAKIKKIAPINAIREIKGKQAKCPGIFSVDRSKLGLNTSIALKASVSGKIQNIVILFTITAISFLIGFSCSVYQNTVVNTEKILKLICGPMPESVVFVNNAQEKALYENLKDNPDVENSYMFTAKTVAPENLMKMNLFIFDSLDQIDKSNVCFKGNLPKKDNEIAINGAYADKNSIVIGDKISFSRNGEKSEFKVCGFTQGAINSGYDGYILRTGFEKIEKLNKIRYFIFLKNGVDTEKFNKKIASECDIIFSQNFRKSFETASKSYASILQIASVFVISVSVIITGFVLYILISIILLNKRREHGIMKSLGFVTKQIMLQTVLSIMPPFMLASALGLLLSKNNAIKLLSFMINNIGVFRAGDETSLIYLLIAFLAICSFMFLFSLFLTRNIRKITPHELFNNE